MAAELFGRCVAGVLHDWCQAAVEPDVHRCFVRCALSVNERCNRGATAQPDPRSPPNRLFLVAVLMLWASILALLLSLAPPVPFVHYSYADPLTGTHSDVRIAGLWHADVQQRRGNSSRVEKVRFRADDHAHMTRIQAATARDGPWNLLLGLVLCVLLLGFLPVFFFAIFTARALAELSRGALYPCEDPCSVSIVGSCFLVFTSVPACFARAVQSLIAARYVVHAWGAGLWLIYAAAVLSVVGWLLWALSGLYSRGTDARISYAAPPMEDALDEEQEEEPP